MNFFVDNDFLQNLVRRQDAGTNSGNNNETATTNNNTATAATMRTEVPSSVPGQVNVDTSTSSTSSTQSSNDSTDAGNSLAAAAAQGAGSYPTEINSFFR